MYDTVENFRKRAICLYVQGLELMLYIASGILTCFDVFALRQQAIAVKKMFKIGEYSLNQLLFWEEVQLLKVGFNGIK